MVNKVLEEPSMSGGGGGLPLPRRRERRIFSSISDLPFPHDKWNRTNALCRARKSSSTTPTKSKRGDDLTSSASVSLV